MTLRIGGSIIIFSIGYKMDGPSKTIGESSDIIDTRMIFRFAFVAIISLIVFVAFLIGLTCYNVCCCPEPGPRFDRTTWSTDRRSKNRVIRKKKRKAIMESTDDVNTAKHSTSCDGSKKCFGADSILNVD